MMYWKYSEYPVFVSDDKEGDSLHLSFVLEYIDDIAISGEKFVVYLQKDTTGWSAKTDRETSFGMIHDGMIDKLIAEINTALKEKADFDIANYVMSNKEKDAFFSHATGRRRRK